MRVNDGWRVDDGADVALRSSSVRLCTDVNGDGIDDLAMPAGGRQNVYVLLGKGDGTFAKAITFGVLPAVSQTLAVGDLNGDGKPDFALGSLGNASQLSILLNASTP